MTHLDTGTTGAKRQSWKHDNPRDVLLSIIKQYPTADKEKLLEIFMQMMFEKSNRSILETIIEYWFANNLHSLLNTDDKLKKHLSRPKIEEIKENIRAHIKIAAGVILMDMMMPNNKRLATCSGQECAAVGGWLSVVAARMSPSAIVSETFSEKDMRAMLIEFQSGKK